MSRVTINHRSRPKGDPIEVVGLGLFENGYIYEVDGLDEDRVFGTPDDSLPVKTETTDRDDRIAKLAKNNTHEQLDVLAEEYKVTFDPNMTKEQKAAALVDSQEGDD